MSQEFNHDGYMSLLTGAGSRRDPETTAKWLANPVLGLQQLTEMFQSGGVARTVVELPANEMVRPWFTVAGDKGKEVLDVLESIGAQDLVTSAVVWARLYGGSVAVFSLDGGNYSSPVRQFKNLQGGRVFDRNQVTLKLDRLSRDPVRQLNGLPEYIEVSVNRGMGAQDGSTVLVNEERFVYVPGARAPSLLRDQQGWDAPILQHCQDAILRYTMGLTYTSNILRDFVQGVLSVKNLTSMLASGQEEIVQRRLQLLDLSRSILNTMLLDEDGEAYTKSTSSVAGLEGIIDRYLEQLSMASGIPVTKLAGRSAAGLNATGDGDLANYYDMLAAERKRVVSPLVERLVQLVYRSAEGPTGGTEPENWSIEWNPFFQLTDLQEAELRNKIANTDKIYLDARVLSPAEVANSRFGKGEFSMETEIDESEERSTFADMAEEQMALLEAAKAPKQETGEEGSEERADDEREDWIVDQPRVPAGSPKGGQFTSKGGGGSGKVYGNSKVKGGVSEDESLVVATYMQESSEFNRSLREKGEVPRHLEDDAETLDSLIERSSLTKDLDIYRGISGSIPSELKSGAVIYDPAYASTSTNRKRALEFSEDSSTGEMGYYLRIYAKKGMKGLDSSAITGDSFEQEVLLPRSQRFKVISVKGKEVYVHALG